MRRKTLEQQMEQLYWTRQADRLWQSRYNGDPKQGGANEVYYTDNWPVLVNDTHIVINGSLAYHSSLYTYVVT